MRCESRGIGVDTTAFNCGDGEAEGRRAQGLEGLGRCCHRDRLVRDQASASAPPSSSATTPRRRRARSSRWSPRRQGGQGAEGRRGRRDRAQPDAVLRRVRRPGRRRRRDHRGRVARCSASTTRRRSSATSSCTRQGARRAASRPATRSSWRSITRAAPRSAPTTPRPIFCTRRCARCSARTSRRRARWSRPIGCASISRITKPMRADELARGRRPRQRDRPAECAGRDAADGARRGHASPAPWRCSARSTATRCASYRWVRWGQTRGSAPWQGKQSLVGRAVRRHARAPHGRHRPRQGRRRNRPPRPACAASRR